MQISEIISVLGGSVFGAFTTFFFQKKREKRDDFSVVVAEYKELFEKMKQSFQESILRENKCEENVEGLKKEIGELRKKIEK